MRIQNMDYMYDIRAFGTEFRDGKGMAEGRVAQIAAKMCTGPLPLGGRLVDDGRALRGNCLGGANVFGNAVDVADDLFERRL